MEVCQAKQATKGGADVIMILLVALLQTCDFGQPPNASWVAYFGEPLCPPGYDGEPPPRETAENLAYINADDMWTAAQGYPMEPSIEGELAYFTNPAHMAIADAMRAEALAVPIEDRIVEHFGIDRVPFGEVTNIVGVAHTTHMSEWTLYFESGAVFQYFRRRPEVTPNGKMMVILHGCGSSAKTIAWGEGDYHNSIGERAVERGYSIIVPYVNGSCFFDGQIDRLGNASGVSHLAYTIQGVRAVLEHAQVTDPISLFGMSKGGIVAGLLAALDSDVYKTVTISGHDIFDFLLSGQPYFARPNRAKHFAYADDWGRYMTADEWVMDYLQDGGSRVVLEMSTHDSNNGKDLHTVQDLIADCEAAFGDCSDKLRTIWFSGKHEVPYWWSLDELEDCD